MDFRMLVKMVFVGVFLSGQCIWAAQAKLEVPSKPMSQTEAGKAQTADAQALVKLGDEFRYKDKPKAIEYYMKALDASQAASDWRQEAIALDRLGNVYQFDNPGKAVEYYGKEAELYRKSDDFNPAALAYFEIGKLYEEINERQKAVDAYKTAFDLIRSLGDKADPTRFQLIAGQLGTCYDRLGNKRQAIEIYRQLLDSFSNTKSTDADRKVFLLGLLSLAHRSLDEHQQALEYANQFLTALQPLKTQNPAYEALEGVAYAYLTVMYHDVGDRQKEQDMLKRAIAFRESSLEKARAKSTKDAAQWEVASQFCLGLTYNYIGEKQKALEAVRRAHQRFQAVKGTEDGPNERETSLIETMLTTMIVAWSVERGDFLSLEELFRGIENDAMRNNRIIENHTSAQGMLQILAVAQRGYRLSRGNGKYGTLQEVADSGVFNQKYKIPLVAEGYRFDVRVTKEGLGFDISAVPEKYGETGKLSFYLNENNQYQVDDRKGEPIVRKEK